MYTVYLYMLQAYSETRHYVLCLKISV